MVTTEDGARVWGETVELLVSCTVPSDAELGSSVVVTTDNSPRVWVETVELDAKPGSPVVVTTDDGASVFPFKSSTV